jgi:hypothetical protein
MLPPWLGSSAALVVRNRQLDARARSPPSASPPAPGLGRTGPSGGRGGRGPAIIGAYRLPRTADKCGNHERTCEQLAGARGAKEGPSQIEVNPAGCLSSHAKAPHNGNLP